MKQILCYGDSHTWGYIPDSGDDELMLAKRFERGTRWTSILQQLLGNKFYVIEAGLNGRNTSFDETQVVRPSRNGLADLPLILEMNYPLDLVILMLGTNDVKMEFQTPAARTAQAMKKLIGIVKNCHFGPDYAAPQVLLIAPPPLHKINSEDFRSLYNDSSIAETQKLPPLYAKLAEQEQCPFIDASKIIQISSKDGVHFDREGHTELAQAIAKKIEAMKL